MPAVENRRARIELDGDIAAVAAGATGAARAARQDDLPPDGHPAATPDRLRQDAMRVQAGCGDGAARGDEDGLAAPAMPFWPPSDNVSPWTSPIRPCGLSTILEGSNVSSVVIVRTSPPPPPTLWAKMAMPCLPVVVIAPSVVTLTAPPFPPMPPLPPIPTERLFSEPLTVPASDPSPPPPPTLCARMPNAATPCVRMLPPVWLVTVTTPPLPPAPPVPPTPIAVWIGVSSAAPLVELAAPPLPPPPPTLCA